MSEEKIRTSLYNSFKNRALVYYQIFDELRKEIGEEKATEIMKRAIYKRGLAVSKSYKKFAPNDMEGLKKAYIASDPDGGNMFAAEATRCDSEGFDLKTHRCPLRDAWQEAGLPDKEIMKICEIATVVDNGTFEGAGFDFSAETWRPEFGNFCYYHIRAKKAK